MKYVALAALAVSAIAVPASATVYDFSVVSTVQSNGDYSYVPNYQFSIDTTGDHSSNDYSITFFDVLTTGQRPSLGSPQGDVVYSTNYNFYPSGAGTGGGFDDQGAQNSYYGAQLFSGTTADLKFIVGNYDLFDSPDETGTPDAVLKISSATSAVPEPASWAFLIAGVGAAGGMMRRHRRATRTAISFA